MKKWNSLLSVVLSAAVLTPSLAPAVFAQEFEEVPAQTETTNDLDQKVLQTEKQDSQETPADESKDTQEQTDSQGYSWKKDFNTVYAAKLYKDELAAVKPADDVEKKAVEEATKGVESYLYEHEGVDVYRVYNPNSGEHHYTLDENEYKTLVSLGWKDEGIGWIAPKNKGQDVFRLYNPNGEHHYTLDAKERDHLVSVGWKDEGIGWKSADPEDKNNVLSVFREYNPNQYMNNHNYTPDAREHRILTKVIGWNDEKIGWTSLSPVSKIAGEDGSVQFYDNKTLKQLTGDQVVGGQNYFLDPKNDGKAFSGLKKTDAGTIIYGKDGVQQFGLVDYDGNTYFLDWDKGLAQTGTILLDADTKTPRFVTFDKDGHMIKNKIVDGVRYDSAGTKLDLTAEEELKLASLNIFRQAGKDLKKVYNWTYETIKYKPSDKEKNIPNGWSADQYFAKLGFEDQSGSAKVFAATFATLAQNLGYDAKVEHGQILLTTGWTDHSWVSIQLDGKEYYYDPMFERTQKGDGNLCWQQDAAKPKYQYKKA